MRDIDSHVAAVVALVHRGVTESVPVGEALGRVTASKHVAVHASPPFDNSAMDGFALRSADLDAADPGNPVTLVVRGESRAGSAPLATVEPGVATRIMTGAPIPHGADSVVAQELVRIADDGATFTSATPPGSHIRRRGEDLEPGDLVLDAGVRLGPRHVAAAAAGGLAVLEVVARPRVGFLVTGDELVAAGEELRPGAIHDSNGLYLAAALVELGAEPVNLGRLGDDADAVLAAIRGADVELVVTTGGASVGDHDPVKAALAPLGVDFTRVAMQPGKPQGLGTVDDVPVLCLPGNPVAVAVSVELFVGAAVRAMAGVDEPPWSDAIAGASWGSPADREQVIPVVLDGSTVRPATASGSGSHLVGRLAAADALARVAAEVTEVAAGDTVLVRRFTA